METTLLRIFAAVKYVCVIIFEFTFRSRLIISGRKIISDCTQLYYQFESIALVVVCRIQKNIEHKPQMLRLKWHACAPFHMVNNGNQRKYEK